jgi:ketosteroid isomerase-like protein
MRTADDLERVKGMYSAFARGDVAGVIGVLAPQLEWIEAEGFPTAGTYRTPDAVLHQVFARLGAEWDDFAAAPQEYLCADHRVVVLGRYSGRFRATGKLFDAPFAHVWSLHGGRVIGFRQFTDTAVVQQAMH